VFELKVEKISGELNDSADWVGSIDPYLKFTLMGKCIYTTQKLQGGGSHPEWLNDHFQTILASPTLSCHVYDEDLINDDYLGECIFNIPTNPCTTISAPLHHKQENCG
jgi:Ca2+-dependent lipid-binding protein